MRCKEQTIGVHLCIPASRLRNRHNYTTVSKPGRGILADTRPGLTLYPF